MLGSSSPRLDHSAPIANTSLRNVYSLQLTRFIQGQNSRFSLTWLGIAFTSFRVSIVPKSRANERFDGTIPAA